MADVKAIIETVTRKIESLGESSTPEKKKKHVVYTTLSGDKYRKIVFVTTQYTKKELEELFELTLGTEGYPNMIIGSLKMEGSVIDKLPAVIVNDHERLFLTIPSLVSKSEVLVESIKAKKKKKKNADSDS